jgi:hypothetical protein
VDGHALAGEWFRHGCEWQRLMKEMASFAIAKWSGVVWSMVYQEAGLSAND